MLRRIIIGLAALSLSGTAIAGDPFEDARYYLQVKQNAEALAIVDSGRFDVNMQTSEGFSLLHYAAAAGNLEMVKALLARGADPALKANDGFTPYSMAIGTMVKAEIRKAMAAGSPASVATAAAAPTIAASRGGGSGMCALARADPANDGRAASERPFLKAKDAIWYNHPDELAGLIEDCVKVDQQDRYGWTLLHHAADRDRVALARILLDHGAKRTLRNKDGKTAPQLATSAEMRAMLGPAGASTGASPPSAEDRRKRECRQKYEADAALASDSTGRMRAMRRWEQCLKTGRYW